MNEKFRAVRSFFIEFFEKLVFLFIIVLGFLYGIMFYFFGGIDALVMQDIQIYNFLLVSSFTLAGFSMTTAGFLSRIITKNRNFSREFLFQALIFILSGVMLFSNVVFSRINKYISPTIITTDKKMQFIITFFLLIGGTGIFLFFVGLVLLVYFLMKISYVLKRD